MLAPHPLPQRWAPRIAFGLVLAAGLLLYLPGINGPFLFDDQHNFLRNSYVYMTQLDLDSALDAVFSAGSQFPGRGMSRLSFALNYYYSGGVFDPRVFKFTNIVIHLLNAVLVFALAQGLFAQHHDRQQRVVARAWITWMAVLSAAIWLLHPMQLTSVLYAVQRMTSLSALFVLLGLVSYFYGRRKVQWGENAGFVLMALGIGAGSILGLLNKENAVLLPFLAFVVHLAFFPTVALTPVMRRRLAIFHLVFVGGAAILAIGAMLWTWSSMMSGFELRRDFTMGERLLTQPRVLLVYLSLFLLPSLRRMSLHHDDLIVSSGLLTPISTLVAIVLVVSVLGFALYRLRSGAIWAFAVVFFIVAHAMESSYLPLEMMHEHRNYLPSFALAVLFAELVARFSLPTSRPVVLAAVVAGAVLFGVGVVTWARVGIWSNEAWLMRYMAEQHPNSYRALALTARAKAATGSPISEVFGAYAEIARTAPTTIFPLMRMRRAVNAMQFQLKEGLLTASSSSSAPLSALQSDGWDAPKLYLDVAHLDKVAAALDAEIRRRLVVSPMHNETLAEFGEIRRCFAAKLDLCLGLDEEVQAWLQLALAQSKMQVDSRLSILDEIAWAQERIGDFSKAHATLRKAAALQSSPSIRYQLRRVVMLLRQRQIEDADRLLREVEGMDAGARVNRRDVQRIRLHLEQVRKGEQLP